MTRLETSRSGFDRGGVGLARTAGRVGGVTFAMVNGAAGLSFATGGQGHVGYLDSL